MIRAKGLPKIQHSAAPTRGTRQKSNLPGRFATVWCGVWSDQRSLPSLATFQPGARGMTTWRVDVTGRAIRRVLDLDLWPLRFSFAGIERSAPSADAGARDSVRRPIPVAHVFRLSLSFSLAAGLPGPAPVP